MSKKKKQLREAFRIAVFSRDHYKCAMCGKQADILHPEETLDAHHITDRSVMPSGGYVPHNGISLCESCHLKAEAYHASNKQSWVAGFHPDDPYNKIGSSCEEAEKMSKKLLGD